MPCCTYILFREWITLSASTHAACGLYYLAELIEEHINIAKKVLVNTIKTEVGLHLALLLWDREPVIPLLLGAVTHASYLRLLRQYPFIPVAADTAILSLGELICWCSVRHTASGKIACPRAPQLARLAPARPPASRAGRAQSAKHRSI